MAAAAEAEDPPARLIEPADDLRSIRKRRPRNSFMIAPLTLSMSPAIVSGVVPVTGIGS